MSLAINSHVLTGTNPCINKAIHVLLMHRFVVLRISIPGPTQKLRSSSVMCIVAHVISCRQHDVSLCPGSTVFKTFAGNMPFSANVEYTKKDVFEAFSQRFSSEKMFLCSNSDQTCFSDTFTSAGPLGRCWNPRLSARVFKPSPFCSCFNTSLGAQQMLMHRKSCSILTMYMW